MSVLSVQAVAKRFGERLVFSDVSFRLAHGDRVGLVGPNGVGKTTLLRVAAGFGSADAGNVALARGTRIGFIEQEILFETAGTVDEHARGAAAHLRELEAEMHELEPRLGSGDQELLERYAEVQHQFEHAGGYDFEATVGRVLGGLGLAGLRDRQVATLSGGERTRLGLARLLLDDPDLLLLDEPTNHLDVAAPEWLERFLIWPEIRSCRRLRSRSGTASRSFAPGCCVSPGMPASRLSDRMAQERPRWCARSSAISPRSRVSFKPRRPRAWVSSRRRSLSWVATTPCSTR